MKGLRSVSDQLNRHLNDSKNPRRKMRILEESFEAGALSKEEYEKEKKILEPDIKKTDEQMEEKNKKVHEAEEKQGRTSDKPLIYAAVILIIAFIAVVSYVSFNKDDGPKTLEEMHMLNLQGKLDPALGYVYEGAYSFINFDDLWYTQLQSPKGTKIYMMALRYSPRDVEDITIRGRLDTEFFDKQQEYYMTFDPTGEDFTSVALAVADFNTHMAKVFEKNPIAACDRNETSVCQDRPIVTCEDKKKLVVYIKESDEFKVYYDQNCIVVEGKGMELVKGVDRVLYNLYGMMGQEAIN